MNGGNAQDGINGLGVFDNPPAFNGAQGVATHAGGFFQPGTGADGLPGESGGGGGGGGGGGSASYPQVAQLQSITSTGAGGGGGGEGGQGGLPGKGGGGGGGSFGLYIHAGGPGGKLTDCKFESGLPGIGNLGGTGGVGGIGGLGGFGGAQGLNGQPSACQQGAGGNGGKGGNGGAGGNGGKGADGVSFPYYISPSTPFGSVDSLIQGKPNEPTITAYFNGCSEKDVTFEALASGSVTWFFGAGANPVSATGSIAKVRYSTLGRKTVTALINGEFFTLTEFIDIRSSGAGLTPSIVSTADTICTGTPALFSSSIASENFEWTFGGAFPNESGTTVNSVTKSFATPGNYIVTLRTYTSCCGFSDVDTFRVFVRPNPVTSVSIQTQDGQTTYCQGQTVTFVATAVNPGVAPVYTWLVNGTPVPNGPNSAVFLTNSLNSGDIVSVRLTVTNDCVSGQVFNSNIIVIQTNTPPALVPDANGNCFGISTLNGRFAPNEAVQFSANATGGAGGYTFLWNFGNGASGVGQSTSCIYTQPGRYVVRVQVVDQFGCSSEGSGNICSDTVEIFNYAKAAFTASNVEGCAPLTVEFENQSQNALAYLWNFGNGTPTEITPNPVRTFTAPGVYDVTLQAFGSFVNDTSFVRSQIVVHPRPVADFVAVPTFPYRADDTVKFGAASIDAVSWRWDFGDPASGELNTSTQPNPVHFYAQEGEYTVTLVVENVFGCKDSITKQNYIQKKILVGRPSLSLPDISLYPNPFSESFTLRLPASMDQPFTVDLLTLTGQVLESWQAQGTIVQIKPERLATSGVYFIRLTIGEQSMVYPIIYNNR
jgi:PKD repeat protein